MPLEVTWELVASFLVPSNLARISVYEEPMEPHSFDDQNIPIALCITDEKGNELFTYIARDHEDPDCPLESFAIIRIASTSVAFELTHRCLSTIIEFIRGQPFKCVDKKRSRKVLGELKEVHTQRFPKKYERKAPTFKWTLAGPYPLPPPKEKIAN
jgi:hypothetical protein